MGYGDWIMASADARLIRYVKPHIQAVVCGNGEIAYWDAIFANNPNLPNPKNLREGTKVAWLPSWPEHRNYIKEVSKEKVVYEENFYMPWPGDIHLTNEEKKSIRRSIGDIGPYIVLEPNTKDTFSPNKDWGFEKYQRVVRDFRDYTIVQVGEFGAPTLKDVKRIYTPTFRQACAVLHGAAAYVGPEGGLHHAAAAFGIPSVVLFGGYISPKITGYDFHVNLFAEHLGEACGNRQKCEHCQAAMRWITPDMVLKAINDALSKREVNYCRYGGFWLPKTEKHLVAYLNSLGGYQIEHRNNALQYVKEKKVFVDIGGHVGTWSVPLSFQFEKVIAFEPHPIMQFAFEKNIATTNVELNKVALGPHFGEVALSYDPTTSGNTHVDVNARGNIEMRPLDSFNIQRIDFLKMDCEGYEPFILQGAKETLLRCKPIICIEQKPHKYFDTEQYAAAKILLEMGAVELGRHIDDLVFGWPETSDGVSN